MILGRTPNTIIAAIWGVFNVFVAFSVIMPTVLQMASVNIALAAVIAAIANTGTEKASAIANAATDATAKANGQK
jgi:hypothetical protein